MSLWPQRVSQRLSFIFNRVAKEFRECTSEITSGRECPNLSGLSEKMMTMQDMLVGESVKVECRMLSRNNDAVYPSYSKRKRHVPTLRGLAERRPNFSFLSLQKTCPRQAAPTGSL